MSAQICTETIKLNTGQEIPAVGLGTWQSAPGEVANAVSVALKAGYRHLDGAFAYRNEQEVGQGLKDSGIPRDQVFITSKLWCTFMARPQDCLDLTVSRLGVDQLDLWLMHWPVATRDTGEDPMVPRLPDGNRDVDLNQTPEKTWKGMCDAFKASGKTKAIGVSNFSIPKLERLLASTDIVPAVNQVECHPLLPQHELKAYCESKGIKLQAYSPLGSTQSGLRDDESIQAIAKKHNVSTSSVLISWQVQRGVIVLPKSVTPSRIEENIKTVKLDAEDMKALDTLSDKNGRKRFIKPDWPPSIDLEFDDW